jgi:hypothetical protein
MDCVRALVLTASPGLDGPGGILFTVKEMDERERAAWKTAWMVLPPPGPSPGSAVEPDDDPAMERKNHALYESKAGWLAPRVSTEKQSFETVEGLSAAQARCCSPSPPRC